MRSIWGGNIKGDMEMREISFRLVDKKMSMKRLGDWEPIKFKITLEVPHCFGQSIIRYIKKKEEEFRKP